MDPDVPLRPSLAEYPRLAGETTDERRIGRALRDCAGGVLISGDPVQQNGRVFMFGPGRDLPGYVRSLEKLLTLQTSFDWIWPSHGDLPLSPDILPRLLDGARSILAGRVPGKREDFHGHAITVYDLGFTTLLCDA